MPRLTDDTDFPLDTALTGAEKVVFTEGTSIKKSTLDDVSLWLDGTHLAYGNRLVADGATDQAAALQALIDNATAGDLLLLPPGEVRINTKVVINKAITLMGSAYYHSRILAVGCDGLELDGAASNGTRLINLEVAAASRHTTTPNTLVGIDVTGGPGDTPQNIVMRDVLVDGFQTGVRTDYLNASVLDNVRSIHCKYGFDVYGLSVNNEAKVRTSINTPETGSVGIRFAGDVASEGWLIHDSIIVGFDVGIDSYANTHHTVSDCIIDHCQVAGIQIAHLGAAFGGNWRIHDNYIAMGGAAGTAAINLVNNVAPGTQGRANAIHDNEIIVYSGDVCNYGIYDGSIGPVNIIHDNVLKGFGTADIRLQQAGSIVKGNQCLTTAPSIGSNIYTTFRNLIADNVGTVYRAGIPAAYRLYGGTYREFLGDTTAPATGTWLVGDRVMRFNPTVGQPLGWVCTVAGTPGTWVALANL